ncbi:hypothetical protein RYX36_029998 [Vicia faba]
MASELVVYTDENKMGSKLVVYTDEKWVIDICKNLLHEVEQNTHDEIIVSVSQVPKSLRSSNPEAFTPQFVGLGPYHHYKPDLIMNDKLKLGSSKRALKHLFNHFDTETLQLRLESILSHSHIQAFYHIDVASKYTYQTLLYLLTIDGLFLLGLLHRALTIKPQQDQQCSHFLTGKHGISVVNSAGVELTMNFIVRDVFMLENQIPTHFLKQVHEAVVTITSDEIESSLEREAYQNLGPSMRLFCESLCPFVHEFQNETKFSYVKPWTKIVGEIKKTSENIIKEDYSTNWDNNISNVTIPSVTELHNAEIKFQPSDKGGNGLSSIDFDEIKCQFKLPIIKLDVNSEVIIRNLMAYESLIKSEGLIFTRYIELMRALINSTEDVKLLINEKIIETEMSYEAVAQLFNGLLGKSIRPIKVQNLDQVIKRVNAKFKSSQAQKMAMIKYMSSYGKMLTGLAAIVFLVLTAVQTYCSAFGCAGNSNYKGSSSMHQDGEYVTNANHLFMSSM